MSLFSPAGFLVDGCLINHLAVNKTGMVNKSQKSFNNYYIILFLLFIILGLFIWFCFRSNLSELEHKMDEPYKNKSHHSIN